MSTTNGTTLSQLNNITSSGLDKNNLLYVVSNASSYNLTLNELLTFALDENKEGSLTNIDSRGSWVTANLIQDGSIGKNKLSDNSVDSNKLENNSIITSKLIDNCVTTSKLDISIRDKLPMIPILSYIDNGSKAKLNFGKFVMLFGYTSAGTGTVNFGFNFTTPPHVYTTVMGSHGGATANYGRVASVTASGFTLVDGNAAVYYMVAGTEP